MDYLRKSDATHHAIDPRGFILEYFVIGLFQCVEATYKYRRIDRDETQQLEIQPPTKFIAFPNLNQKKGPWWVRSTMTFSSEDKMDIDTDEEKDAAKTGDLSLLPGPRNFPAVDLIRHLGDLTEERVTFPETERHIFRTLDQIKSDSNYLPRNKTFESIDAIRASREGAYHEVFQMTVFKQGMKMKSLLDTLSRCTENKPGFYFVVPKQMFPKFFRLYHPAKDSR